MAIFGNDRASICPGTAPAGTKCEFATENLALQGYMNDETGKMEPADNVTVCSLHYREQYLARYGGYPEDMPAETPEGMAKTPR